MTPVVRKHRAPKGTLRLNKTGKPEPVFTSVRKHRAPKGALRRKRKEPEGHRQTGQKAPSAKRCIKTVEFGLVLVEPVRVRKHRAPKGALRLASSTRSKSPSCPGQRAPSAKRCIKTNRSCRPHTRALAQVRKQRAPKGALRLTNAASSSDSHLLSQKVPSAKRCIKTRRRLQPPNQVRGVRKRRAPKGALRPVVSLACVGVVDHRARKHRAPKGALTLHHTRNVQVLNTHGSESTERQKVH